MSAPNTNYQPPSGVPRLALVVAAVCLVGIVAVVIVAVTLSEKGLDNRTTPLAVSLVGLVVSIVPGLVAAAYAERASRDIRNGTVIAKTREGAAQAIRDEGVVTHDAPVLTAQVEALTALLNAQGSSTAPRHRRD